MPANLKASIPATEVWTIKSRKIHQEYRISVALPPSYVSKTRKKYPTIYLLDANWYFGMVTELTRMMALCGHFPETIIVGIGYPVDERLDNAFTQIVVLRSRDLTPVSDKKREQQDAKQLKVDHVQTGGASKLLQFLETELIPCIETRYRTSPADKVLAGHSYGGLFVLFALFHRLQLFSRYVAASPSLWFGDKATFRYETQFAKRHKLLPVKLFLSVGRLEESATSQMVSNTIQFIAQVESRKYKNLSLIKHIADNCDHCASTAPTFQAGLQAVLS